MKNNPHLKSEVFCCLFEITLKVAHLLELKNLNNCLQHTCPLDFDLDVWMDGFIFFYADLSINSWLGAREILSLL